MRGGNEAEGEMPDFNGSEDSAQKRMNPQRICKPDKQGIIL